jgi:hypothetical protein
LFVNERDGRKTAQSEAESSASGGYSSRKLTFAENAVLTIKVLLGFGLIGAALWGVSVWKAAQ